MQFVRWFHEITIDDVPLVGGKNASLGEMFRELRPKGVNLADGFAVTAEAYRHFLRATGVEQQIQRILADVDPNDVKNLQERGRRLRQVILAAELPQDLQGEIVAAYEKLSASNPHTDVAVRSSATAEDLPDASFAGQQETYLNVQGTTALLESRRRIGFGLIAYCPGTDAAAVGQGNLDAITGIFGMIFGSYLFALASKFTKGTVTKWGQRGKITLAELAGVSPGVFIAIAVPVLVGILIVLEMLFSR